MTAKEIKRKYDQQRYKENKEQIKENSKNWSKTPKGKESLRKAKEKYRNSPKGKATEENYYKNHCSSVEGKEQFRKIHLKRMFNIGIDDYDKLFKAQKGRCAICFETQEDRNLAVDHDHKCCPGEKSCGKCIRGLLCQKCNTILGLGDDSILLFQEVIRYIEKERNNAQMPG